MIVSLYTSRIVLQALGVDDYGVYNVVGGTIAMFSIISSPISTAISRFLTFGLGKGDDSKLRITFATSISILLILGGIIVVLAETIGVWFLNTKMNIPPGSLYAANWVLQCSVISLVLGLLNIPYNAALIAHERMNVFAYMSILEVVLKLAVAFSLLLLNSNRLIFYAIEILLCYGILRIIYWLYCVNKFEECKYKMVLDRPIFKEMTGFAWWSFFGNTASILNTQGVAILMNLFFGVVVNTAKGIAGQVEAAVVSFVNSFTTAFTPQITKSYAEGNKDYMFSVMSRGSRFSIYLFLFFLIPLEFEAPYVIRLWLGEEPLFTASFLRLSLLCTATLLIGSPYLQGINATGKIKNYQIAVTAIGWIVFPLTWVAYKINLYPEAFYWIYLLIYNVLIWVRAGFVNKLLGYNSIRFLKEVFIPIIISIIVASIVPFVIYSFMPEDSIRLIVLTLVSFISTSFAVYLFGITKEERLFINNKLSSISRRCLIRI